MFAVSLHEDESSQVPVGTAEEPKHNLRSRVGAEASAYMERLVQPVPTAGVAPQWQSSAGAHLSPSVLQVQLFLMPLLLTIEEEAGGCFRRACRTWVPALVGAASAKRGRVP